MTYIKKRKTRAAAKPVTNDNVAVAKLEKKVSRLDKLLDTVVNKLQNFYVAYVVVFGVLALGSFFGIGITAAAIAEQSRPHGFFIFTAVMATLSTTALFCILVWLMLRAHDKLAEEANKATRDEEE